jgi:hypothetical protein
MMSIRPAFPSLGTLRTTVRQVDDDFLWGNVDNLSILPNDQRHAQLLVQQPCIAAGQANGLRDTFRVLKGRRNVPSLISAVDHIASSIHSTLRGLRPFLRLDDAPGERSRLY